MLERIICHSMMEHFEQHNVIIHLQHDFRSGHSCESQLLITIHDIISHVRQKELVDIVILDFNKAFDTVPHNKLLHKLDHVEQSPYLGVMISNDLKWTAHIDKICNKANSTRGFLRRN